MVYGLIMGLAVANQTAKSLKKKKDKKKTWDLLKKK